jgi:hypothetical protein
MVDYQNMSSDRMAACRVFSGEILRIRTMIAEGDQDAEFLNQVINYLEMRIDSMKSKEHYR